jgi:type II secretory pathway pseudopilin PulG
MNKKNGFTVIELIIAVVCFLAIGVIFLFQRNELLAVGRDDATKVKIDEFATALTDFHNQKGFYPVGLTPTQLSAVDPDFFDDTYKYEGINCNDKGECVDYKLSADLEKEDAYAKSSIK